MNLCLESHRVVEPWTRPTQPRSWGGEGPGRLQSAEIRVPDSHLASAHTWEPGIPIANFIHGIVDDCPCVNEYGAPEWAVLKCPKIDRQQVLKASRTASSTLLPITTTISLQGHEHVTATITRSYLQKLPTSVEEPLGLVPNSS